MARSPRRRLGSLPANVAGTPAASRESNDLRRRRETCICESPIRWLISRCVRPVKQTQAEDLAFSGGQRGQLVVLAIIDRLDCLLERAVERVGELVEGRGAAQLSRQLLDVTADRRRPFLEVARDVNRPAVSRK